MLKKGTVCRVIKDDFEFFKPGDIVVTMEDSAIPYCCPLNYYNPEYSLASYQPYQFSPMEEIDLEGLHDWAVK